MKSTFKLKKPDDLEATITLTAKVSNWRFLNKQLDGSLWPSNILKDAITDVINQAEKTFYGESKGDEP